MTRAEAMKKAEDALKAGKGRPYVDTVGLERNMFDELMQGMDELKMERETKPFLRRTRLK